MVDDLFAVVAFDKVTYFSHDLAGGFFGWIEANIGALDIRFFKLHGSEALDLADARLHLASARTCAKAGHEILKLRDLFFFALVFRFGALAHGSLGYEHIVVVARIDDQRFIIDVGDMRGDGVEEVAVVADYDQRSRISM